MAINRRWLATVVKSNFKGLQTSHMVLQNAITSLLQGHILSCLMGILGVVSIITPVSINVTHGETFSWGTDN